MNGFLLDTNVVSELRKKERCAPKVNAWTATPEIAQEWGRLSAQRPIPPEDGLLAATALVHRLTLVTRNVKNVEGLGVSLLNPWS